MLCLCWRSLDENRRAKFSFFTLVKSFRYGWINDRDQKPFQKKSAIGFHSTMRSQIFPVKSICSFHLQIISRSKTGFRIIHSEGSQNRIPFLWGEIDPVGFSQDVSFFNYRMRSFFRLNWIFHARPSMKRPHCTMSRNWSFECPYVLGGRAMETSLIRNPFRLIIVRLSIKNE
jgi:hypothetical protein